MKQREFEIINIFPHTNAYGVGVVIKVGQSYYLVDKAETLDVGWETIVFHCDENGEVIDQQELYTDRTDKSVWKCALEFAQKYFEDY